METNVQPVKVVESNNFLMYTLHDVVIKSAPCKGLRSSHTVYVFSYLFYMYTFLCKSTFGCLRKSCSLTPSCAFILLLEKVHKSRRWRIVYSFWKVCNGCVPHAFVKSRKQINKVFFFCPSDMFIYVVYITYGVHFVTPTATWHRWFHCIIGNLRMKSLLCLLLWARLHHKGSLICGACVVTALSMCWMVHSVSAL